MGAIEEIGNGQGFLKAGFLGFPKSGKTYTAIKLACGVYKFFGNIGRVVMFDTEGGSEYVAPIVLKETGKRLVGKKSRSFADLMAVAIELHENDLFFVDSITHPWRELCDSHLAAVNRALEKRNRPPRQKLEFQDWGPIKAKWAEWTDFYLNSPVHIIIAGRAGWEYEMEMNEDTRKRELIKTGVKMKTESEFGFEPSLLVEMERVQKLGERDEIVHRATVIGDRFSVIDGKQGDNPDFNFFKPHIELLKPGLNAPIDTSLKTDTGVTDDGDVEWQREKRQREILCDEIKAMLIKLGMDGAGTEAKKARVAILERCFGTASWTKIEQQTGSDHLRDGLEGMRQTDEYAALQKAEMA